MSKDYHNKGQEDASKDKYEPPHGIIKDITTWTRDGMKEMNEENASYKEGWHNTNDQKDSKK